MVSKKAKFLLFFAIAFIICLVFLFIWNKNSITSGTERERAIALITREGETLAKNYCSRCHSFPKPELLDKKTWRTQTLPTMGPFLGIKEYNGEVYPLDKTPELPEDFYPENAVIQESEWKKILHYYEQTAPDRLQPENIETEIITDNLFFQSHPSSLALPSNPMTSAVRIDPESQLIYMADAASEKLFIFNRQLEILADFDVPSPISDIQIAKSSGASSIREVFLTHIGSLAPSDAREGAIIKGWFDTETGEGDFDSIIINDIARPVETLERDLDEDGFDDLLISEFGHRRGSLFWLKNEGDQYDLNKRVLISTPGCLQSEVKDFTGDGYPDILALCSQVDQAIYLFTNDGKGSFEQSTLLKFPITAGSSSFELVDFNQDGLLDILYTSGDNADYSLIYKPYHGVYIFLNNGDHTFSEKWFYPVNGAYSAKAVDFDQDGNLDIAAISYFADYPKKPQEGFIIFKNSGDFSFQPYHPQRASYGRWITMDTGDLTGNGFEDIVLANLSLGPTKVLPQIESILINSPHILTLENHFYK